MFTLAGNVVSVEPSVLLLDPFKAIWERHEDKDEALREFAYVYFMVSPRRENVFAGYSPEVREQKVNDHLFGRKFKPDKLVKEAMEFYEDYLINGSIAMRLYQANVKNIESMINYLNDVDYAERTNDGKGTLVHNIDRNKKIAEDSAKILEGLQKLEQQIYKEEYQGSGDKQEISNWDV